MSRILLFEDNIGAADAIKEALVARGHEVEIYFGLNEIHNDHLLALNANMHSVTLHPEQFEYAFVDGALKGRFHDGYDIVPALMKFGVVCCGISDGKWSNEDMEANGAFASCMKGQVIANLDTLLAQAQAIRVAV